MPFEVSRQRLAELIGAFSGRRLVVAGDFVLDRFILGEPKRVSREAPVLILRHVREDSLPGGAGNTAANVRALGGEPVCVGVTGRDEGGKTLREILRARGIPSDGFLEVSNYRTPTKTRILGGASHGIKQQIVRYDIEDNVPRQEALTAELDARLRTAARGAHGAILSDYGYGSISASAVASLRQALPSGARICVDSRHRLAEFTDVDAATPNEEELEESAGAPLGDSDERLALAGSALRQRMRCPCLLVTRGSRGMALFDGDAPPLPIPVHGTDQVADVTGAGDTVLATFALALCAGATPLEAALLSNFAGGTVVTKMGTAVVTPEELRTAVEADRVLLR
ncbi:MAG: bifunctional ADP-heptose synthase [Acidobacteriota bacterium]